jgi:hypothetical protein
METVQKLFASKGADITIDELTRFRAAVMQKREGKLTDDELASVAGGGCYHMTFMDYVNVYIDPFVNFFDPWEKPN